MLVAAAAADRLRGARGRWNRPRGATPLPSLPLGGSGLFSVFCLPSLDGVAGGGVLRPVVGVAGGVWRVLALSYVILYDTLYNRARN